MGRITDSCLLATVAFFMNLIYFQVSFSMPTGTAANHIFRHCDCLIPFVEFNIPSAYVGYSVANFVLIGKVWYIFVYNILIYNNSHISIIPRSRGE